MQRLSNPQVLEGLRTHSPQEVVDTVKKESVKVWKGVKAFLTKPTWKDRFPYNIVKQSLETLRVIDL